MWFTNHNMYMAKRRWMKTVSRVILSSPEFLIFTHWVISSVWSPILTLATFYIFGNAMNPASNNYFPINLCLTSGPTEVISSSKDHPCVVPITLFPWHPPLPGCFQYLNVTLGTATCFHSCLTSEDRSISFFLFELIAWNYCVPITLVFRLDG